ncbi:unnamed protein product [Choristocarpus tenellus]
MMNYVPSKAMGFPLHSDPITSVRRIVSRPISWHLGEDFTIGTGVKDEMKIARFLAFQGMTPLVCLDYVTPNLTCFQLGKDATLVATEPNAGGNSVVSEALSMEYFSRRFGAQDVVTEMTIKYWRFNWKKVDYICTIGEKRVGVSVTRAMGYPGPTNFETSDAERLLHKKLYGLIIARRGVSEEHQYDQSILHCWCQDGRIACLMSEAFQRIDDKTIAEDVAVLFTVVSDVSSIFSDDKRVLVFSS